MRSFIVAATALLITGCATAPPQLPASPTTAFALARAVHFHHQAQRAEYTCSGLAEKISVLLAAVGVRETRPMEMGCTGSRTLRSAEVRIYAAVLVPASAANLSAAAAYTPTDRLLARVQGRDLPAATELEQIPAAYARVKLSTHGTRGLGPGDCELLQSFREFAPSIGLRVVGSSLSCDNAAAGRMQQSLSLEALLPTS